MWVQLCCLAFIPWNEDDDYFTTTLAGGSAIGDLDGAGVNATFNQPSSLAIDTVSLRLYISDRGNHKVRVLDLNTSVVETFMGSREGYADGAGTAALLRAPAGVAVDPYGGMVYVADSGNCVVRAVDLSSRRSSTLAGTAGVSGFVDGRGLVASFSQPTGLALHVRLRQLFVCDPYNHAVRVINVDTGAVGTLCGTGEPGALDGPGESATLLRPFSVAVDDEAKLVYISDRSPHVRRAKMSDAGGTYSPSVTTAYSDNSSLSKAGGVAYAYGWSSLLVTNLERSTLHRLDLDFEQTEGAASNGSGALKLLAGGLTGTRDGMGTVSRFYWPEGLAVDYSTQSVYVADTYNHRIRHLGLTDVEDPLIKYEPTWEETASTVLEHNLQLILVTIGGSIGGSLFLYLSCRFCMCCPLYRRKLHEKRVLSMSIGQRL